MKIQSENFLCESQLLWEEVGGGGSRQIAGYDREIMLVKF